MEVRQLLQDGRSLKCWLSAFRFSFKYIRLLLMKTMIFLSFSLFVLKVALVSQEDLQRKEIFHPPSNVCAMKKFRRCIEKFNEQCPWWHFHAIGRTCDDGNRKKIYKKGWRKMPAHSTMCICHIGLALTSHNLLRIKNSVYVHNSLFVPHKFSFSSPISSRTHQFFSYFRILLVREMRKGKFFCFFSEGWVRAKRKKKEKVRKCGNKEYTK